MSEKNKFILITVVVGFLAFISGKQIWPISPEGPVILPSQMPFFIVLSIAESTAFGLGVAFLIYGWGKVNKITGSNRNYALAAFYSLVWILVSWWPHDNLHAHIGEEVVGLLMIEYVFHFTLMIAGAVLAYTFWHLVLSKKQG